MWLCIYAREGFLGRRQWHFLGETVEGDILGQEWWPEVERNFPERFCESLGTEPGDMWVVLERRPVFSLLFTPVTLSSICTLRMFGSA